jgi:hypothetical protein
MGLNLSLQRLVFHTVLCYGSHRNIIHQYTTFCNNKFAIKRVVYWRVIFLILLDIGTQPGWHTLKILMIFLGFSPQFPINASMRLYTPIRHLSNTLFFSLIILTTDILLLKLTYLFTPWSRVLLEKLTGSKPSQEILRIFGTRRFLIALTSARQLSLSWANFI